MGRPRKIQDEELLAHARSVFVEKGLAAPTREIAQQAGISEAVLYQRFPTKAELFFAAMVPPAVDIEELLSASSEQLDAQEHLEEIGLSLLAYFRELLPILLPLMTHPSFNFEESLERNPGSAMARIRKGLTEYLATQNELGHITCNDPGPAALALFSATHSLAIFERLGAHGGHFEEDMVRRMIGTLWAGLAP